MSTQAFSPRGKTYELDVTDSAHSAVQILGAPTNQTTYQLVNAGASTCFVAFGPTSTSASVTPSAPTNTTPGYGVPIVSGEIVTYNGIPNAWFSAICASGLSTSLFITAGEGL